MSPLLSLRGLTRTFQVPHAPDLHILTGVDLDVEPGEHIAIVGRSGTGKSTLLNILGLIDQPTSGTYTLEGQDATRLSEGRRARLRGATFGFVFQSFNLIEGLSTTENVAAPLLYDTGRSFWTRTARAGELLDAVGLGDKVDSPIGLLSGGEQQRVAIARAVARRPRVILADEPTGALDVDTGTAVMELLEAQCAQRGAALIVITHDLAVAARASTQYRLDHGVLTPVTVTRHRVGTLEEFGEAVAPSSAPAPSPSAASSPSAQSASSAGSGPVPPRAAPAQAVRPQLATPRSAPSAGSASSAQSAPSAAQSAPPAAPRPAASSPSAASPQSAPAMTSAPGDGPALRSGPRPRSGPGPARAPRQVPAASRTPLARRVPARPRPPAAPATPPTSAPATSPPPTVEPVEPAASPPPTPPTPGSAGRPVTPLSAPTPAPAPTPVPRPDASTPASGGPHPTTDGPQPTTQDLQDTQKIGVVP